MKNNFATAGLRIFQNDESGYQAWLVSNPFGYVLNADRKPRARYLPLHMATCHTIKKYRQYAGSPAFTGGRYIKICARHPEPLLAWIAQFGAKRFTTLCSSCNPVLPALDELAVQNLRLLQDAERLSRDSAELERQLKTAPKKPQSRKVEVRVFNRSAAVVAAVLRRAKGKCEGCGSDAPFLRAGDGAPFLEVHHKVPLAHNGDDNLQNAMALCPNCHRRKHFG